MTATQRVLLSDKLLKSIKPRATVYDVWDTYCVGLSARVSPKGRITWTVVTRLAGSRKVIRRSLGRYPVMSLKVARDAAETALRLASQSVDVRDEIKKAREQEARRRANTLSAVIDDYAELVQIGTDPDKPNHRTGPEVIRNLKRHFRDSYELERKGKGGKLEKGPTRQGLGHIPITEIQWSHIQQRLDDCVWRGSPAQGRHLFSNIHALLEWAMARETYDLQRNVCAKKGKALDKTLGKRKPRDRTLSDDELRALWKAAKETTSPIGGVIRLLMLTACRRDEIGWATRGEFDLPRRLFVIPSERYKTDLEHTLPLSEEAVSVLDSLPRHNRGYLFTTTNGDRPYQSYGKDKPKLASRMLEILHEEAEKRGEDPRRISLKPWRIHDIRRSCRSIMSALKVPFLHAEKVLGHSPEGSNAKTYDHADYLPFKKEALDALGRRMFEIVGEKPMRAT